MKAALLTDIIDAVIYVGDSDIYPEWFVDDVLASCYIVKPDELRWLQSDETDDIPKYDTLIPFQSVVLRNKYGDPYHVPFDRFAKKFYPMGSHKAALMINCVDVFIVEQYTPSHAFPDWLSSYIHDGVVVMDMDIQDLYDRSGEYRLKQDMVFVRGKNDTMKCLTRDEFDKYFYMPYPNFD